jgi:hypothetical protein
MTMTKSDQCPLYIKVTRTNVEERERQRTTGHIGRRNRINIPAVQVAIAGRTSEKGKKNQLQRGDEVESKR